MHVHALRMPEPTSGKSALSDVVSWSRMQAESGQNLRSIIARKERERSAGDGLFCWGVGNAPARSIAGFARLGTDIDAVFSMMKSPPKAADAAPARLVIWRSYFDAGGEERPLPSASLVTSRGDTASKLKTSHYALMCRSETPLAFGDFGPFDPSAYRNVSESGGMIGASQVTALLRRVTSEKDNTDYRINLRAKLTRGYWVKLGNPLDLGFTKRDMLERALLSLESVSASTWLELVADIREGTGRATAQCAPQQRLI